MTERMLEQGVGHLWLDATGLERFDERFPTIAASVRETGLDPATDWLPVAPAAHYSCGGVVTDLDGASTLPGLWACGEVACTGVHGANRLASNSLLEGMVFAPRAVEALLAGGDGPRLTGAMRAVLEGALPFFGPLPTDEVGQRPKNDPAKAREELQRAMTEGAGVVRTAESLATTGAVAHAAGAAVEGAEGVAAAEVRNLATVAGALVAAATARTESRGCHWRADFPDEDPAQRRRLVLR